jgi:hypothetical protein
MDAFVEEIASFDWEDASADLQELIRLTPILWVASNQGYSLANMAAVDFQYRRSSAHKRKSSRQGGRQVGLEMSERRTSQ